jgi:hypothetical protein
MKTKAVYVQCISYTIKRQYLSNINVYRTYFKVFDVTRPMFNHLTRSTIDRRRGDINPYILHMG